MYIFDTDHLGVLQRQRGPSFEKLITRLADTNQSLFYTTIVSFHEQINGWTKYIKNSVQAEKTVTELVEYRHPVNNYRLYKAKDLDRLIRKVETQQPKKHKPK